VGRPPRLTPPPLFTGCDISVVVIFQIFSLDLSFPLHAFLVLSRLSYRSKRAKRPLLPARDSATFQISPRLSGPLQDGFWLSGISLSDQDPLGVSRRL